MEQRSNDVGAQTPKAMFDYIGIALIVVVVTMQKLRKEGAHAAA